MENDLLLNPQDFNEQYDREYIHDANENDHIEEVDEPINSALHQDFQALADLLLLERYENHRNWSTYVSNFADRFLHTSTEIKENNVCLHLQNVSGFQAWARDNIVLTYWQWHNVGDWTQHCIRTIKAHVPQGVPDVNPRQNAGARRILSQFHIAAGNGHIRGASHNLRPMAIGPPNRRGGGGRGAHNANRLAAGGGVNAQRGGGRRGAGRGGRRHHVGRGGRRVRRESRPKVTKQAIIGWTRAEYSGNRSREYYIAMGSIKFAFNALDDPEDYTEAEFMTNSQIQILCSNQFGWTRRQTPGKQYTTFITSGATRYFKDDDIADAVERVLTTEDKEWAHKLVMGELVTRILPSSEDRNRRRRQSVDAQNGYQNVRGQGQAVSNVRDNPID